MTYFPSSKHRIKQNAILHWTMQGKPGRNANLEIALKVHFVDLGNLQKVLVHIEELPQNITIILRHGMVSQGRWTVLVDVGRSLTVEFEGEMYTLFDIENVTGDTGELYFHAYLPKEFGSGDTVYSDLANLESIFVER